MTPEEKAELTAPCGLDCFNCHLYEKVITEDMKNKFAAKVGKDPEDIPCKGCRAENGFKHLGKPCETLKCIQEKKLNFCFECEELSMPLASARQTGCGHLSPQLQALQPVPHEGRGRGEMGRGRISAHPQAVLRRKFHPGNRAGSEIMKKKNDRKDGILLTGRRSASIIKV